MLQHSSRLKQKTSAGVVRAFAFALGHAHQLIAEELVGDPAERERHFALFALHQLQFAAVRAFQPRQELRGIADRGG